MIKNNKTAYVRAKKNEVKPLMVQGSGDQNQDQSIPRNLALKTWHVVLIIFTGIGGVVGFASALWIVFGYTAKIGKLEEASTTTQKIIERETTLRKIDWSDRFVYKHDSTDPHYLLRLRYDIPKDTLIYYPR